MREIKITKTYIKDAFSLAKNGFDIDQINPLLEKLRNGETLDLNTKTANYKASSKIIESFI